MFGNSRPIIFIKNAQGLSNSFVQTLRTHPNGMLMPCASRNVTLQARTDIFRNSSIFVFCSLSFVRYPQCRVQARGLWNGRWKMPFMSWFLRNRFPIRAKRNGVYGWAIILIAIRGTAGPKLRRKRFLLELYRESKRAI